MLLRLHREIDARTREIASAHGDWPCRKGCDGCCRRLAELPRVTRAEWELLKEGLDRLPENVRAEIRERIAECNVEATTICPFLDRREGVCLVYDYRPVACRTYGFYVERHLGLYCGIIEKKVDAGEMAGVVWGNVAGVEQTLAELGEKVGLVDASKDWRAEEQRLQSAKISTTRQKVSRTDFPNESINVYYSGEAPKKRSDGHPPRPSGRGWRG